MPYILLVLILVLAPVEGIHAGDRRIGGKDSGREGRDSIEEVDISRPVQSLFPRSNGFRAHLKTRAILEANSEEVGDAPVIAPIVTIRPIIDFSQSSWERTPLNIARLSLNLGIPVIYQPDLPWSLRRQDAITYSALSPTETLSQDLHLSAFDETPRTDESFAAPPSSIPLFQAAPRLTPNSLTGAGSLSLPLSDAADLSSSSSPAVTESFEGTKSKEEKRAC